MTARQATKPGVPSSMLRRKTALVSLWKVLENQALGVQWVVG
jgi:hypothetical protein